MKHIVARIYLPKQELSPTNKASLKIQNNNILFLRQTLLEACHFSISDDKNSWELVFFKDTSYKQHIFVKFLDISHIETKNINETIKKSSPDYKQYNHLYSACCLIDEKELNQVSERLSISVRESKSIKENHFLEHTSHHDHIDGKGFSFFTHLPKQVGNFERSILLLSLAYAYLEAMAVLNDELSKTIAREPTNVSLLQDIYIKATKFNGIFFYNQPVLHDKTTLAEVWERINNTLGITKANQELLNKLSNAHYILNLDKEQKQQKKQFIINIIFALAGILIGAAQLSPFFK
ncbi:hypothetical protein [Avibacterium avium]|uniref:hypothetical protein n=1 Tax=Avibacterium avium TaxID=751 RepID=UPI003BF77E2E